MNGRPATEIGSDHGALAAFVGERSYVKLDIGCGKSKQAGFVGMDRFAYNGVDVVHDVDSGGKWPFEDSTVELVRAVHVIEHIRDLRHFFEELHRACRHGAIVHLETPHYSSRNSWNDPTHVHHLAVDFCDAFINGYLADQLPGYRVLRRRLSFGSFWHTWPARLYTALFGYKSYEKYYAWIFPASSVIVDLQVCKE